MNSPPPFALSQVSPASARQGVSRKQYAARIFRLIVYHSRNAKPAKTETALVLSARPLSMVLDNVGDIGEPCKASRLRE